MGEAGGPGKEKLVGRTLDFFESTAKSFEKKTLMLLAPKPSSLVDDDARELGRRAPWDKLAHDFQVWKQQERKSDAWNEVRFSANDFANFSDDSEEI